MSFGIHYIQRCLISLCRRFEAFNIHLSKCILLVGSHLKEIQMGNVQKLLQDDNLDLYTLKSYRKLNLTVNEQKIQTWSIN